MKRLTAAAVGLALATTASPALAQNFSYDFNTQASVNEFAQKYITGLQGRVSWQGGNVMRVRLLPNDSNYTTTENLTELTDIETESSAPTAANLRYRMRFSTDFQFERQGKLPGLASFRPHFGGNRNDPPAKDSWSYRQMWFPGTPALKRPDMYLYDQSRLQGNTGTHHTASTAFGFQRNVWYDIRMFIILNTLSSNGNANANGKAVLYVNGVAAVCRDGLKFRGNGSTNKGKIGRLAFHVYHGGAAGPDEFPSPGTSSFVDFDNFSYTRQSTTGVSRTC